MNEWNMNYGSDESWEREERGGREEERKREKKIRGREKSE